MQAKTSEQSAIISDTMTWCKRILRFMAIGSGVLAILLLLLYFLGPRPAPLVLDHHWPQLSDDPAALEKAVHQADRSLTIRPDNQGRLIWFDPLTKAKTAWALLYLHGFSACWFEGEPLHRNLGRELGMNVYLPRLAAHALDTAQPLLDLRPEALYRSALQALAIAEKIGQKVVIVGTSTGASLALMLAAQFPSKVSVLLLFSPNIRLADKNAWMLTQPWGLQLARLVMGSPYRDTGEEDALVNKYWYRRYRLEGLVAMQTLIETAMVPDTFAQVKCPLWMGYYYQDEAHQDQSVSVAAMLDMFAQLGTSADQKTKMAFPAAGVHVIGNEHLCHDFGAVYTQCRDFLSLMMSQK